MPTLDPAANFAKVTVSQGYDSAATSIVLESTDPNLAQLPDPATAGQYNVIWWNSSSYADPSDDPYREIVRVTAKNVATLTISRAQEGTTATNKNTAGATYRIMLAPTKKLRDDLENAAVDIGSAYGWVTEYGAVGNGTTDDRGAFANAAAALTHIVIPSGTYRIASDITFGNTITLEFWQGANLSIDSGKTVTISGNIIAGDNTIFTGSGTATLSTRCPLRYDRWDGTSSDKVQVYADLEMTGTTKILGGCTIVESSAIDVSTTGAKNTSIAHGLGTTPDIKNVSLTVYRSSGSNDASVSHWVKATDGTNVDCCLYVDTAAATTEMKIVARIQH